MSEPENQSDDRKYDSLEELVNDAFAYGKLEFEEPDADTIAAFVAGTATEEEIEKVKRAIVASASFREELAVIMETVSDLQSPDPRAQLVEDEERERVTDTEENAAGDHMAGQKHPVVHQAPSTSQRGLKRFIDRIVTVPAIGLAAAALVLLTFIMYQPSSQITEVPSPPTFGSRYPGMDGKPVQDTSEIKVAFAVLRKTRKDGSFRLDSTMIGLPVQFELQCPDSPKRSRILRFIVPKDVPIEEAALFVTPTNSETGGLEYAFRLPCKGSLTEYEIPQELAESDSVCAALVYPTQDGYECAEGRKLPACISEEPF